MRPRRSRLAILGRAGAAIVCMLGAPAFAAPQAAPDAATPPPDSTAAPDGTATAPVAAPALPSAAALAARPIKAPQSAPELLSTAWMQSVLGMIGDPDISDEGLESALDIALMCGAMTPDRPSPWRLAMYLADQLEVPRPELALAARRTAMSNLARLEPKNDSITLARLSDAIEGHGTAEQRVRAYEQLLAPENATRLSAVVRSRLAYQLAMLENRMGNTELFARWLGEAVKLDPAYPQATMAAAGFFRTRINDPAVDVELLCMAIEANPRNMQAWSALITVLLDNAAYAGAERVCRDALAVAEGNRHWAAINNLTCDQAMALWGLGRRDEALRLLTNRTRVITDDYRRMLQFSDTTLTPDRIRAMFPPLPASLALSTLALASTSMDADNLERMVGQAMVLTEPEKALLREEGIAAHLDAMLDKAVIALLFKKDASDVGELLADTASKKLLPLDAQARFEGLLDWRAGRVDQALAKLEPIREGDALARYGYASALQAAGRTADAAREFHALAKSSLGTALGLMALDRLAPLLNQTTIQTSQLDPAIAERARALDAAVTAHLPAAIDNMMAYPLRMLSVQVTANSESAAPFSCVTLRLTLRNLARIPLAIGRTDPLISRVALRAVVSAPGEVEPPPLTPTIIPFDPALQLAPGEQIDFVIDATLTPLGRRLARRPLLTQVVSPSVVVNPRDTDYGPMPAFLGTVTAVNPFIVPGVVVSDAFVHDSIAALAAVPPTVETAYRLVLLVHAAAAPDAAPEAARAALTDPALWKAVVNAWEGLDATEQAWVTATIPPETPAMAPLLDVIRGNTRPLVLMSWLLSRISGPDDPMLDVARRGDDPRVAQLADAIDWMLTRRDQRALEQLNIGGGGARP